MKNIVFVFAVVVLAGCGNVDNQNEVSIDSSSPIRSKIVIMGGL